MGFRNPVTTAVDPTARALAQNPLGQIPDGAIPGSKLAADVIDGRTINGVTVNAGTLHTSSPGSTAGVDVYQYQVAPSVESGIVEWRTASGASKAQIILVGAGSGSGGSTFRIGPGQNPSGTPIPELQLNIESAAAGGYTPAARLKNAGLQIDSPGTRLQGLAPLVGAAGLASATTDASAQATITHGLGVAPLAVIVTPGNGGVIPNLVDFVIVAFNTTTFTVRAIRRDNNTAFASNPVQFTWVALLPAP